MAVPQKAEDFFGTVCPLWPTILSAHICSPWDFSQGVLRGGLDLKRNWAKNNT